MASTFGKREFMESVRTLDPSAANIRTWAKDNEERLKDSGWKFEDHHRDPKLYSPEGFYVDVIRNAGADDRDWQWIEERKSQSGGFERDPRLRSPEDRQKMYSSWGYAPRRDAVSRGTMGDMMNRRLPARQPPDALPRHAARPAGVRETDWSPPSPQLVGDVVLPGNIPPPQRPRSRNDGTIHDALQRVKQTVGRGYENRARARDMDPKRYRYPVNRRRY